MIRALYRKLRGEPHPTATLVSTLLILKLAKERLMTRAHLWPAAAATLICLAVGCSKDGGGTSSDKTPAAGGASAGDAIKQALAKLSAEDQILAAQQKTCPVTGEQLGSMDKPDVVEVSGRKVLLCCEGCREKLLDDPEKYLAKLPPAEPVQK